MHPLSVYIKNLLPKKKKKKNAAFINVYHSEGAKLTLREHNLESTSDSAGLPAVRDERDTDNASGISCVKSVRYRNMRLIELHGAKMSIFRQQGRRSVADRIHRRKYAPRNFVAATEIPRFPRWCDDDDDDKKNAFVREFQDRMKFRSPGEIWPIAFRPIVLDYGHGDRIAS